MDRKGTLAVILLFFMLVKASDASLLGSYRRMIAVIAEMKNNDAQIPPSPSPVSAGISNNSGVNASQDQHTSGTSTKVEPKDSDNNGSGNVDKGPNQEGKDEKCPLLSKRCNGENKVVACLKHYNSGSQELYVLVQNDGETNLTVVLTSASATISPKELEIPKHEARKFNVSTNAGESPEIVLNAGDCEIHVGPTSTTSEGKIFQWIPSYAYQLTPVYGAYLTFVILLIVGGTWACCKFGKKGQRTDGGIPYQELEMGLPGSGTATNVETADGWDQGWDDDWDEERAVKSSGSGSVSANGLTSRSPNREGWENGWDE